jgi:putative acetyltransferase
VRIRPATPDDRPAVDAVVAAAFGEGPKGRVIRMVRALDATEATRASLVAADGDALVGHVQLSRSWVDARRALVEVLVLSPLSVLPDRQGEGIGTALVAGALTHSERLAAPAVFVEGGWEYYGRRGFRRAAPLGFGRPSLRIPERAFQVAVLPMHEQWMVGRLVYAEAFWSTDTVGLRDPLLAQEARSDRLETTRRRTTWRWSADDLA